MNANEEEQPAEQTGCPPVQDKNDSPALKSFGDTGKLPTANIIVLEKLRGAGYPSNFIADSAIGGAIRTITLSYTEQRAVLAELRDAGEVKYDPERRGWKLLKNDRR